MNSDGRSADASFRMLSMLRLGSAALPIGAFAYSQGLESAIAEGVVQNGAGAEQWIGGVLNHSLLTCDVPLLSALRHAFDTKEQPILESLNTKWRATRATFELREEDRQLGGALMRLLSRQTRVKDCSVSHPASPSFGYAFALAGYLWGIRVEELAHAYCFSWLEAQLGAAIRLIPLGQSEAQEILTRLLDTAATGIQTSVTLASTEVSSTTPGQALYSARHESLYSRLFRS